MDAVLGHLNADQLAYVLACYGFGMKSPEIVPYFRDMFPDFGVRVKLDDQTLNVRLYERFKKIKSKHADEIEQLRDPSHIPSEHPIPIANSNYRLKCLHQIWKQTPEKSLLRRSEDPGGNVYEVYRSNARERVAILAHAVVELRYIEERGLGNLGATTATSSGPAQGEFGDVVEGDEVDGKVEHSHSAETVAS